MNIISKQYYEFLSTLQEIFRITSSKEIKITKVDKGVICFQNQENNDIETSIANYPIKHCLTNAAKHIVFFYDGVHILDKNDYNKYSNMNNPFKVIFAYNGKEIDFFSFMIACLAEDYSNLKKNVELEKALSILEIISYSRKFIANPGYARLLYDRINNDDLVQPLITTMYQIKNFLEQNKIDHIRYLNINKENKIISFRIVTVKNIKGKIVQNITKTTKISKSDIPAENNNRYNISYYDSILECLHKDIKFLETSATQSFTIDEFYVRLLSYSKRFDCLVSKNSIVSTIEGQETDEFASVQKKPSTKCSVSSSNTQTPINLSTKHKGFAANTIKNKKISRITNMQSDSTAYYMPPSHTQTSARSSTEHSNLIPYNSNSNEQQFSTSSLILIGAMSGFIIFLVLALAYCYYKKRNSDKVETGIDKAESTLLSNRRRH